MMRKTTLARVVDGRERYYILSLAQNLFGEWELDRVYGALRNKRPTGKLREFYDSLEVAVMSFESILKSKTAKGYAPLILC